MMQTSLLQSLPSLAGGWRGRWDPMPQDLMLPKYETGLLRELNALLAIPTNGKVNGDWTRQR
jgi:hypothetical protein